MAQDHQAAEKDDGPNMNEYFDKCNDVLARIFVNMLTEI
jgi:hypothetical protein